MARELGTSRNIAGKRRNRNQLVAYIIISKEWMSDNDTSWNNWVSIKLMEQNNYPLLYNG